MSARRRVEGVVKSASMDKTISVVVQRLVKHPRYGKYVKRRSVLKAHDENNKAAEGDRVRIVGSRPLSKNKHWRLASILEKAAREKA